MRISHKNDLTDRLKVKKGITCIDNWFISIFYYNFNNSLHIVIKNETVHTQKKTNDQHIQIETKRKRSSIDIIFKSGSERRIRKVVTTYLRLSKQDLL